MHDLLITGNITWVLTRRGTLPECCVLWDVNVSFWTLCCTIWPVFMQTADLLSDPVEEDKKHKHTYKHNLRVHSLRLMKMCVCRLCALCWSNRNEIMNNRIGLEIDLNTLMSDDQINHHGSISQCELSITAQFIIRSLACSNE